jgi:hypothetical protein
MGALVAAAAALIMPAAALGGLASDVQRGQRLVESIRSGEKQCSDLSPDDFELIGEYAIGRYRFSGCSGGPVSGWMGGDGLDDVRPLSRRLGQFRFRHDGRPRREMMGFGASGDTDIGIPAVVLIALAAAALGGGLVLMAQRLRRTDH